MSLSEIPHHSYMIICWYPDIDHTCFINSEQVCMMVFCKERVRRPLTRICQVWEMNLMGAKLLAPRVRNTEYEKLHGRHQHVPNNMLCLMREL